MMFIKWITIRVKDMSVSKKFYEDFLGLKVLRSFSPCAGRQITFLGMDSGGQIELICDEAAESGTACEAVSIGISVADFEGMYQKAKEYHVPHSEPEILGKGTECFFLTDPDGIKLQIIREEIAE